MNLGKLMKKMSTSHYIFLFLVVAFVFLLYNYDSAKSMFSEKYSGNHALKPATIENSEELNDYDLNGNYAAVQNVSNDSVPNNVPSIDPSELLPSDEHTEWSELNPNAPNSIEINLLKPMVSQSNKNPNLQVRSEPVIPQSHVGPWNNTTITPQEHQRGFELN